MILILFYKMNRSFSFYPHYSNIYKVHYPLELRKIDENIDPIGQISQISREDVSPLSPLDLLLPPTALVRSISYKNCPLFTYNICYWEACINFRFFFF